MQMAEGAFDSCVLVFCARSNYRRTLPAQGIGDGPWKGVKVDVSEEKKMSGRRALAASDSEHCNIAEKQRR